MTDVDRSWCSAWKPRLHLLTTAKIECSHPFLFLESCGAAEHPFERLCPHTPAQATPVLPTVGAATLRARLDIIYPRSCSLSNERN